MWSQSHTGATNPLSYTSSAFAGGIYTRRVPGHLKRVSVVTSASGAGGTTFARSLADRLGVPFHELDALFWRPGWTETPAKEFRALVEPIVATDAWVIGRLLPEQAWGSCVPAG